MDLSEFLAGIMQSVNSTLGTANFKPLNELIDENSEYILCPSDMILQSLNGDSSISSTPRNTEVFSKSYKVNISGMVKISLYGYSTGSTYESTYGEFKIYKNSSVIKSTTFSANEKTTAYTILEIITEVKPNDIIKVSAKRTSEYGSFGIDKGYANIYATPVPIRFKNFITLDESSTL